jgi:hypothetical protein
MSLLRVRSLPACYNYVTPPGAVPSCVLEVKTDVQVASFATLGLQSLWISGSPVSGYPGVQSPGLRVSGALGFWVSGSQGRGATTTGTPCLRWWKDRTACCVATLWTILCGLLSKVVLTAWLPLRAHCRVDGR